MTCCPECTCEERAAAPAPAMTIVDHEIVLSDDVTEGWECFGTSSHRADGRLGSPPILRPITVEWSDRELTQGIRAIEVCVDMEDPADAYVKVRGVNAKQTYETWQRTAAGIAKANWFQEPF